MFYVFKPKLSLTQEYSDKGQRDRDKIYLKWTKCCGCVVDDDGWANDVVVVNGFGVEVILDGASILKWDLHTKNIF